MRKWVFFGLIISLSVSAWAKKGRYEDDNFKDPEKRIANVWPSIPFFQGGDIGQYELTMSQDRDSVRKEFWNELTSTLEKLADKGAAVEVMAEPLANILMMFDQIHDIHKAKDVVNIDVSIENQFKASLDEQFVKQDIRDSARKIQLSAGTDPELLQSYVRRISVDHPLGVKITRAELKVKTALEMYDQIDYVAYGTFSSLGGGQFQLTLHLQGSKNGVTRSFMARGRLTAAVDDLSRQLFDFFQKNEYPDWQPADGQLQWLPMPVNENRDESGYTFAQAKTYCQSRGYRLPYARELLDAESGSNYRRGGVAHLEQRVPYAVADRRRVNGAYFLTSGLEERTGGPIQPDHGSEVGKFWCVKGQPSAETRFLDKLWELHRRNRGAEGNKNIFAAVETLRFELGDSDTDILYWGDNFEQIRRLSGIDEALEVLRRNGIELNLPASLSGGQ